MNQRCRERNIYLLLVRDDINMNNYEGGNGKQRKLETWRESRHESEEWGKKGAMDGVG